MRRDFGNEMLAAGTIIVLLMAAMTFGVLLSSMANDTESPATTTPAAVGDVPTVVTSTVTPSVTARGVTATRQPSATHTATPRTAQTSVVTITPTDAPTSTPTATHTASSTATATSTPRPTVTASPTPTTTPSYTAAPPIRTVRGPVLTIPPRPSATPTPRITTPPDSDLGIVPTPTAQFTATPTTCTPPAGWLPYVVEPNITLFMIAVQVGRPVAALQSANCLRDADRIEAGQVIYVPRLPVGFDAGREPQGCNNLDINITSPRPNQRISTSFDVLGTVDPPLFGYFNLEIRADEAEGYNFLMRSDDPVVDGLLGRVDVSLFAAGRYWVRVVFVDATGNVPTDGICAIPIVLD